MMRISLKLFLLASMALLSACGQQGPLYFPEEAPAQTATDASQDNQAQDSTQP